MAERLWRRPAKPMESPRAGSNPTGVVSFIDPIVSAARMPCMILCQVFRLMGKGLLYELDPAPRAPSARIIPHAAQMILYASGVDNLSLTQVCIREHACAPGIIPRYQRICHRWPVPRRCLPLTHAPLPYCDAD